MRGIKKVVIASALAAAAVGFTAPAANAAAAGDCSGTVDTACRYCAYGTGTYGNDPYWCNTYPGSYHYVDCTLWVSNSCIVG